MLAAAVISLVLTIFVFLVVVLDSEIVRLGL